MHKILKFFPSEFSVVIFVISRENGVNLRLRNILAHLQHFVFGDETVVILIEDVKGQIGLGVGLVRNGLFAMRRRRFFAEEFLPTDEAVVIFIGDLHDVHDLLLAAVDAVFLEDVVVLVGRQAAVAVAIRFL